jgi:Methyltransferase FkbM domain
MDIMKINRNRKFELFGFLLSKKSFVTTRTNKRDVLSLIKKLSPVTTGKELLRMGPSGDGGYLVPADLEGIEACFSPGVSSISGFEKDCADLGMTVYLADKSVGKPAEIHERFNFLKKYIGAYKDDDFITIDDWVKSSGVDNDSDLLLQMDIEGYEYETILSCSGDLLNRFRIIIVEFHDLDQLWNKPFFNIAASSFNKILQTHACVHIHPNNYYNIFNKYGLGIPPLAEFTFLRKDRLVNLFQRIDFPHPMDRDNTNNVTQVLPKCWYS